MNFVTIQKYLQLEKSGFNQSWTGNFSFYSSWEEKQIFDESIQKQPVLHLSFGNKEFAMARGEYTSSPQHVALHIKIYNAYQDALKGKGMGFLLALCFGIYLYETEKKILVSSRSNSLDAFSLWQRLVKANLATLPAYPSNSLDYLYNNSTREKMGLPDKFSVWSEEFFARMDIRFQINLENLLKQKKLIDFFHQRYRK